MNKVGRVLLPLALMLTLVPLSAGASHEGCSVVGEVQGLDTERTCSYKARTTSQTVLVATPYEWRVWVERMDSRGQPVTQILASGTGPVAGAPPEAHPIAGETVFVTMVYGCTGPYCGTIGFLGAGLEQGHP